MFLNLVKPQYVKRLTTSSNIRVFSTIQDDIVNKQRKRRPTSPHVTIYKFPIAALSSITTRVTGTALSVGFAGAGLVALFG